MPGKRHAGQPAERPIERIGKSLLPCRRVGECQHGNDLFVAVGDGLRPDHSLDVAVAGAGELGRKPACELDSQFGVNPSSTEPAFCNLHQKGGNLPFSILPLDADLAGKLCHVLAGRVQAQPILHTAAMLLRCLGRVDPPVTGEPDSLAFESHRDDVAHVVTSLIRRIETQRGGRMSDIRRSAVRA
ncbi:hypothetical protein FQZ97_986250 [compost metagenome]